MAQESLNSGVPNLFVPKFIEDEIGKIVIW